MLYSMQYPKTCYNLCYVLNNQAWNSCITENIIFHDRWRQQMIDSHECLANMCISEIQFDKDCWIFGKYLQIWNQFGQWLITINDLAAGEELYSDEETRGLKVFLKSNFDLFWSISYFCQIPEICFFAQFDLWKVLAEEGGVEALLGEGKTLFYSD